MGAFEDNYKQLNAAQKQAVDTIDGPLLVLAGPGTGKTQLLSMRVANILRQTDVLPSNILCLTFTESGATAMRERLLGIMGQAAYNVAIHTFHSFGSEVMNRHADYFYSGAHFQPADELSSYEILRGLFDKLPLSSPIASTLNGKFTHLRDTQRAISDLKKSGLLSDELIKILDNNNAFLEFAEPLVQSLFESRLNKQSFEVARATLAKISTYKSEALPVTTYQPIAEMFISTFEQAISSAETESSTKPLTAWRNDWLEKDLIGNLVFKDHKQVQKLRAIASIYYDYLLAMQERSLYDFDDMILRVVHATEVFADLRFDLQEQYQYILVDEFQDTNGAQLRLLLNIVNSELNENRPNVMAVGDDDQAIYSFQGAESGNITDFQDTFPTLTTISLTENYRSAEPILRAAGEVSAQIISRHDEDKKLSAQYVAQKPLVELAELPTRYSEYYWVTKQITKRLKAGQPADHIAVIARNHNQLISYLPYLHYAGIAVSYERRDNVLDSPPVVVLTQLANVVDALARQDYDMANAQLPELLSHPAWKITPEELWQLSLTAFNDRRTWFEVMKESQGVLKTIADWLFERGAASLQEPLEFILDTLTGTTGQEAPESESVEPVLPFEDKTDEKYISPFREYFFSSDKLNSHAEGYMTYLEALTTLRHHLREYAPDKQLKLADFIEFVRLHRETRLNILTQTSHQESKIAIQLMTAHKAKGLEFDTVFIINSQDSIWGNSARTRHSLLSFPHNLPLAVAGETEDERIRLLYVAMTRARNELLMSSFKKDTSGRDSLPAKYLHIEALPVHSYEFNLDDSDAIAAAETTWHDRVTGLSRTTMDELLGPTLAKYQLSATHLNNFIDVPGGGPQTFLLQNLLRFPQAMSVPAVFGSCIHKTLQRAHQHLTVHNERRPLEDVLHDYEEELGHCRLSDTNFEKCLQKGIDTLTIYLGARYDGFKAEQKVERSFSHQGVVVDDIRLSGTIDLIDINHRSSEIIVTDYKTGKPSSSWQGKTDFEKVKLHKYRQQLMLYKLLIEHSRDYGNKFKVNQAALEFVEADTSGSIKRLEIDFNTEELNRFKLLLKSVWKHIMSLDLQDVSTYEQNYKGILAFEQDLIDQIDQK